MANEPKPLMIRGERLLFAFRLMDLCRRREDNPSFAPSRLSFARLQMVFRARFGDNDIAERAWHDLGNWASMASRLVLEAILIDNPRLMHEELNVASLEGFSRYGDGAEPAGIRPVLELIARGELTEADFREGSAT